MKFQTSKSELFSSSESNKKRELKMLKDEKQLPNTASAVF